MATKSEHRRGGPGQAIACLGLALDVTLTRHVSSRDQLDLDGFRKARAQLEDREFWANDAMWQAISASLPNYRLSKFQPLMPPWVEREVVADYLLDVGGAWRWITGTPKPGLQRVPWGALPSPTAHILTTGAPSRIVAHNGCAPLTPLLCS